MQLHPRYLVDEKGERTEVLLPVDEFRRIVEALEDQLDAADFDEAVANERDFTPYNEVRNDLRSEGKL